jgi:hypothetical protein
MTELRPCLDCHRHVAAIESACPFCGAGRTAGVSTMPRLGRLSRAAVFAGAALATAACGGKKAKSDTMESNQTQTVDAGVATPAEPAPIPMPYGAPPARRRIV